MPTQDDSASAALKGLAYLSAMVFYYFARETTETLGEKEGHALIARAIRQMGEDRGRRIRAAVDAAGEEPTLDNMFKYYDLPIGHAWQSHKDKLEGPVAYRATYTYCPLAELWQSLSAEELGLFYCDIDVAIVAGYNPDIEIRRLKSLLQREGCCLYEYSYRT
jgi:hypothetical protein